MSVTVKKLVVGPIEENCYIVYREETAKAGCILVDPGAGGSRIVNTLKSLGKIPQAVFLTHGHFDHIMAVDWVLREYPGTPVYAWEKEKEVLEDPEKSLLKGVAKNYALKDVVYLKDGSVTETADLRVRLTGTPGHTAGSACYHLEEDKILFSGDTLFKESAGRTDFPTGSDRLIRESILGKLECLPEETAVYPGHGEDTTIGHEKKFNFIMLGF